MATINLSVGLIVVVQNLCCHVARSFFKDSKERKNRADNSCTDYLLNQTKLNTCPKPINSLILMNPKINLL